VWLSSKKFVLSSSSWRLIVKTELDLGDRSERFKGLEQPDPLWVPQWRRRCLCGTELQEQIPVSYLLQYLLS
jgi:hypothetical protein